MAGCLLSTGVSKSLPESYKRSVSQRPRIDQVVAHDNIPVIDLSHPDKSHIVSQIAHACQSYGFFQVVMNHGIADELIQKSIMDIHREFFQLPAEEKMKLYSDDPARKMRLSTSFNVKKEEVNNWRDFLRLHCYPPEEFVPGWPSSPPLFKQQLMTNTPGHDDIENGNNGVSYSNGGVDPAASEENPKMRQPTTHPARRELGVSKSSVSCLVALMGISAPTKLSFPLTQGPALYKCYVAMGLVTFVLVATFVSYYFALEGGTCAARQRSATVIRVLMWMVVAGTIATYCLGASLQLAF